MAEPKDKTQKTSVDADLPTIAPSSKSELDVQVEHPTIDQSATPIENRIRQVKWENFRFFGDYELLEEVARGGMGVVFKARQVNLNRVVALKMILAGHLATDQDVKRFYAEAEAAANLHNPNIVSIHEVGEHDGQHYYSMEFIEGRSLADVIRDNLLSPVGAANYVKTIADAIQYAHDRGTLHRDLKPSNILIDQNDQPRITDFGLAKQIHSDSNLTATGAVLGTPSYVSPEQVSGQSHAVGPATDVYAIGAMFYELLTGRPPFRAETPLKTIAQVVSQEPAPPCILNPAIPKDLETICLKCLQKEPKRRYETAGDLSHELSSFLTGQPIKARPVGRLERVSKWARRQPAQATLLVVMLVGILAVLAGIIWHNGTLRVERDISRRMRHSADVNFDLSSRTLARSKLEQARAQRLAGGLGRSWAIEKLLHETQAAIPATHVPGASIESITRANEVTPSSFELRNEMLATMLMNDALLEGRWRGAIQFLSPDGLHAIINVALSLIPGQIDLRIASSESGKEFADLSGQTADFFALGPGAEQFAIAIRNRQDVQIRNSSSKKLEQVLKWAPSDGLRTSNEELKFSANGNWLVGSRKLYNFGTRRSTQLVVWPLNQSDGEAIHLPSSAALKVPPQFSRLEDFLVFESDAGQAVVWDLVNNKRVAVFDHPRSNFAIQQMALSQSGDYVAVSFATTRRIELLVWHTPTQQLLMQAPVEQANRTIRALEFAPNAKKVAIATDRNQVLIMDIGLGSPVVQLNHDSNQLRWTKHNDESILISSGSTSLNRWKLNTPQFVMPVRINKAAEASITSFKLSHDGQRLATVSRRRVAVQRWPTGERIWTHEFAFDVDDFGFCPDDSSLFVSGFRDGLVFDADTGKPVQELPAADDDRDPYQGVFVAAKKLVFIGKRRGRLLVWDGFTNEVIWPPDENPMRFGTTTLSFDSRWVAYTSVKETKLFSQMLWQVEIWDLNANKKSKTVPGIAFGKFSQDKRWLTTTLNPGQGAADADQSTAVLNLLSRPLQEEEVTYTVWDLANGQPQIEFRDVSSSILEASDQETLLEFSPDASLMAIVKSDGTVELHDVFSKSKILSFSLDQLQGVSGRVKSLQFAPDNQSLLFLFNKSNVILTMQLGRMAHEWDARGVSW